MGFGRGNPFFYPLAQTLDIAVARAIFVPVNSSACFQLTDVKIFKTGKQNILNLIAYLSCKFFVHFKTQGLTTHSG